MGEKSNGGFTSVERRIVQGREVRSLQYPDELYVEWRPGRAVYYGVRVGDRIKDADADVESARIDEWEVTEITPDRVVGQNVKTGEEQRWGREDMERYLVVGRYATNLSDFALVTAYPVGSWEGYDPDAKRGLEYHGRPYLTVIAYGNNGEKYGLRYRFVEEGGRTHVTLAEKDPKVTRITPEMRDRLDEVVRSALEEDGYVVENPAEDASEAAVDPDESRARS
jgi:hypothetical protein